jgi:hypothetical protein
MLALMFSAVDPTETSVASGDKATMAPSSDGSFREDVSR